MGLAFRGNAITDQNGVAIAGQLAKGVAAAGSVVWKPRVEWALLANVGAEASTANPSNVTANPINTTGATLLVVCVAANNQINGVADQPYLNQWVELVRASTPGNVSIFYCFPPSDRVGPGHVVIANGGYVAFRFCAFRGGSAAGESKVMSIGGATADAALLAMSTATPNVLGIFTYMNVVGRINPPPAGWTVLPDNFNQSITYTTTAWRTFPDPVAITGAWTFVSAGTKFFTVATFLP